MTPPTIIVLCGGVSSAHGFESKGRKVESYRRFWMLMEIDCNAKSEFLKQINGEVLYFPNALARCLATFSSRYKRYPIDITMDMDI